MSESDRGSVPARRPSSSVPARNLSTEELEAVIRRAVELQAGQSTRLEDGVSEPEVVRIGEELGLEPAMVRRAIAEVRSRPPAESGLLAKGMGPAVVRSVRTLRKPAAEVARLLEEYLLTGELMLVQRRLPDRTRYVRDNSFAAGMARVGRAFVRDQQLMDVKKLDVAVSALDADSCLVELSVDMSGDRTGYVGGALGAGGGAAASVAAMAWATPIPDPYMLLGLPLLAGSWLGMRAIFSSTRRTAQEKLDSFLDRLEHGEVRLPR